jgi:hypothetical protein
VSVQGDEWREIGYGATPSAAREQAQARLRAEGQDIPTRSHVRRPERLGVLGAEDGPALAQNAW